MFVQYHSTRRRIHLFIVYLFTLGALFAMALSDGRYTVVSLSFGWDPLIHANDH